MIGFATSAFLVMLISRIGVVMTLAVVTVTMTVSRVTAGRRDEGSSSSD